MIQVRKRRDEVAELRKVEDLSMLSNTRQILANVSKSNAHLDDATP